MRVSLLNMTEHPFLIRHKTPFITAEFHFLAAEPSKTYLLSPGALDLTDEEMNQILGRGGPSLKDMHRDIIQLLETMKDAATLGKRCLGSSRNMTSDQQNGKGNRLCSGLVCHAPWTCAIDQS